MTEPPLTPKTEALIRRALVRSWSKKTSVCFDPNIAPVSYGQCAATAIVVFETFGGGILRTQVGKKDGNSVRHFYNRIGGERLDFTSDQFEIPEYWQELAYLDIPSTVDEALSELLPGQIEAMRSAFQEALRLEENH